MPDLSDILDSRFAEELTASTQYYVHAGFLRSWGCNELASQVEGIAGAEREHQRELTDRLYFLGYKPAAKLDKPVKMAESVTEVLKLGLASEEQAAKDYNESIKAAREALDTGTAEVLTHILVEEEQHLLFFRQQLDQIKQIGEDNYIAGQTGPQMVAG